MGSGASKRTTSSAERLSSRERKTLIKTLGGHTGGINCMDVFCNVLLTGSDDRTARLWDLITYECKVVLEGHNGYVSCCKIWQGNYALTGSFDKTIRKWNGASGNCVLKLEGHSGVVNRMLVFGDFLFSSSYDSTIVCWNLQSGEQCRVYSGHSKSVLPLAYVEGSDHDPGGGSDLKRNKDSFFSGSMDKTARLWTVSSDSSVRSFRGHKGAVISLAVDIENEVLFTGSTDHTIRKWNAANGNALKIFKGHQGSVLCLQLQNRLLYSASVDATARCWVAEFGDTTRTYSGHGHMISDMKYHQGIVFTGSGDCALRAFDAKSGTLKRIFKGHKYQVNCLLPRDDMILSASYDGCVKVWNIRDIVKDKSTDSCTTIASSTRSSLTQQDSVENGTVPRLSAMSRNEPHLNGKGSRRPVSFETQNEIVLDKSKKLRKAYSRKIAPAPINRNNNSNKDDVLDFGYISDKLQDILDEEAYWGESSNQTSTVSLSPAKDKSDSSRTPSSGGVSREANSSLSERTTALQNGNARPATRGTTKINSANLLSKRPRTESSNTSYSSCSGARSNSALIDNESRMAYVETSSNTSGYRTADNATPCSTDPSATEKPKLRSKISVSFSPTIASNEHHTRNIVTCRTSKIPTSAKSSSRRHTDTRGGADKRSTISSGPRGTMGFSEAERKLSTQEVLDMV